MKGQALIELECKVAVDSHEPVRTWLREAGAKYVGRVLETNRLFDRADRSLMSGGCGLRVRSVEILDGAGPQSTLTLKGPLQAGVYKRREEIEVAVGDGEATVRLLEALGYQALLEFEKRRESWRLEACRVELDELPWIGCYVEVEGGSDSEISSVVQKLGLDGLIPIRESYAALIRSSPGAAQTRPLVVRF